MFEEELLLKDDDDDEEEGGKEELEEEDFTIEAFPMVKAVLSVPGFNMSLDDEEEDETLDTVSFGRPRMTISFLLSFLVSSLTSSVLAGFFDKDDDDEPIMGELDLELFLDSDDDGEGFDDLSLPQPEEADEAPSLASALF